MKITVNGEVFGSDHFMKQMQRLSHEKPGISEDDAKKEISDDIIKHILLRDQAAKDVGMVSPKEIEKEFNQFKNQFPNEAEFEIMCQKSHVTEEYIKKDIEESMRVNIFVEKLAKDIPPAPEKIIQEYYKRDLTVSTKPREIHAAHIVKQVNPQNSQKIYKEMCELRKKLLNGADFAELADAASSCNDAGGDLGFFARGKMVEEFDVIAFSMEPNEISPVFQTQFGYHVLKVYEVKEESRLSLEDCTEKIKLAIHRRMIDECVNKWLDGAKKKAKIIIEE